MTISERDLGQERRLRALLDTMAATTRAAIAATDRTMLLETACTALVARGAFAMAWVAADEDGDGWLERLAVAGDGGGYTDDIRVSLLDVPEGRGPAGTAARTEVAWICSDVAKDEAMAPWRERLLAQGFRSIASLPLLSAALPGGVLNVYGPVVGAFGPDEASILADLATTIGFAVDALERRMALAASEEQLRLVLENTTDVISVVGNDGRFTWTSPSITRVLGWRPEAFIGHRLTEFLHPDDREVLAAAQRSLIAGSPVGLTLRVQTATGGHRSMAIEAQPIMDAAGAVIGRVSTARDVTAERASQDALRESEARYRAVTESAADAIITIHSSGVIVDANPSACRMFRTEHGALVGTPMVALIPQRHHGHHPNPLPAISGRVAGVMPTGAMDAKALRPDGSEFDVEVNLSAWERGGEQYATAFIRDITDRRRAEREAELANQRLRFLVDANLFGTLVSLPGGRVVEANDYWLQLVGLTRQELERGEADWSAITSPESVTADQRAIEEVRRLGRSAPYEKVYLRRDGTRVPALVVRTAMPGDGELITSVVLDMSALREAFERAQRLAAAIEQTTEAVVITDPRGRIEYVNRAFEQASGYPADEALGQNPNILKSGEHDAAYYRDMWAALGRGETWRGEIVNRRKDGSRFIELATISPMRDATGETVAYVAVKRDVTAERAAENARLQGQRLEALGQLAGGVAHDFNNLLAAIRGYGDFVRDELDPASQARSDMDELLRAVDRAGTLTRRLLVFTRRQAVSPELIDPAAAIAEAVGMLRRLLGDHVELRTDLQAGHGLVLADPGQLEQAVVNLAVNARDAMPEGGVLEIRVGIIESGDDGRRRIRVVVSDTGLGMDEATLARIYEPFFTTKGPGRGTGLGLSVVYGFVQSCGGSIRVVSAPGQGTTFMMDLPTAAGPGPEDNGSEPPPAAGSERLLVVEDDPPTREVVRRNLAALGYDVRAAGSAAEALDILREGSRPDLLLTDVRMPGVQGPDLAAAAREVHPGLRVVFMSGFADAFDSGDAVIDGSLVLEKPFTREALAAAVREALGG